MDPTSTARPCPRCGQPTRADRLGGLCPRCVSRTALRRLSPSTPAAPADFESSSGLTKEAASAAATATATFGPYHLGTELGRGAMGAVYRAHDSLLNREVAVKVILSGKFASTGERRRFLAEAGNAAALDHPGIVPVYQMGETEGRAWFAMKLIEGSTLASRPSPRVGGGAPAAASGPPDLLPGRDAATLVARIARAVQHAHERGVLHRDLKPANILLDREGQPYVTDFGLARRLGAESTLTVGGSPLGTPGYMAPEMVRGARDATTAADVWSLGAILYELLSGHPPFGGVSLAEILQRITDQEPPPIRARPRAGFVSEDAGWRDLEIIALKCLRKEPEKRYVSAAALADDLERWLRGEPIEARPAGPLERAWRGARRRPLVSLLALGFLLSLVLGSFLLAASNSRLASALASTRDAELRARTNWHAALLAQVRARRGGTNAGFEEDVLRAVADAARLNPSLDTRNEAVIALATHDSSRPSAEAVFREFAPTGARPQGCSIDASPDGTLIVAGTHAGLDFWDSASGAHLGRYEKSGLPWMSAHFSPDGSNVVFSTRFSGIRRMSVERVAGETGPELKFGEPVTVGRSVDSTVQASYRGGADWLVALDRNPIYITRVELWREGDPSTAKGVARGEPMTFMSLSSDGRFLASTLLPVADVKLWDAATARPLRELGLQGALLAVFTPDGRHLVTRDTKEYAVWSAGDWRKVASWPAVSTSLAARIRFSPDGRLMAVLQHNDHVQILRLSDWREVVRLTSPQPNDLLDMTWDRSGDRFLLLTREGQPCAWNLPSLRRQLRGMGLDWDP